MAVIKILRACCSLCSAQQRTAANATKKRVMPNQVMHRDIPNTPGPPASSVPSFLLLRLPNNSDLPLPLLAVGGVSLEHIKKPTFGFSMEGEVKITLGGTWWMILHCVFYTVERPK